MRRHGQEGDTRGDAGPCEDLTALLQGEDPSGGVTHQSGFRHNPFLYKYRRLLPCPRELTWLLEGVGLFSLCLVALGRLTGRDFRIPFPCVSWKNRARMFVYYMSLAAKSPRADKIFITVDRFLMFVVGILYLVVFSQILFKIQHLCTTFFKAQEINTIYFLKISNIFINTSYNKTLKVQFLL